MLHCENEPVLKSGTLKAPYFFLVLLSDITRDIFSEIKIIIVQRVHCHPLLCKMFQLIFTVLIFSPHNLNFTTIDPIEMDAFSLQILNELSLSYMSLTDFESQHVILP